jgi:hypothetical protein
MTQTNAPAIPTAAKFARVVHALAVQFTAGLLVDTEWLFMLAAGVDVVAWVPREGYLVLQLVLADGRVLRTATVCPGEYKAHSVVAGNRLIIDETRGAEAAFSSALEYLCAPLQAGRRHPAAV